MKMDIQFNEEKHEYTLNGKKVPSVTQILEEGGLIDFSGVPPEILESARQLGTNVHKTLELWDGDDLALEGLDPVLMKYLARWRDWKTLTGFSCLCVEKILVSEEDHYAGTADRIGVYGDDLCILDIKTSTLTKTKKGDYDSLSKKKIKTLGVQLAGYCNAYNEGKKAKDIITKRVGVFLTEDSYEEIVFDDKEYEPIWYNCLLAYAKREANRQWLKEKCNG